MRKELTASVVAVDEDGTVAVVAIDGRIFVHNSIVDKAFGMGLRNARLDCWEKVNALIKTGNLGGNGRDKNAERNGLVLAANVLFSNLQ